MLSDHLLELLRVYHTLYKPGYWLLGGQDGGQYCTRSVQSMYRKPVKEIKSNTWRTSHTLRHNFATHLMERGFNIRYIQSAPGDSSSRTTDIYTRVSSINKKLCGVQLIRRIILVHPERINPLHSPKR